ncbi:MAG: hypothetical protein GX271_10010 [Clostridiales bacterium]|nr:hypothetical protein [Clostridiales bacterium]
MDFPGRLIAGLLTVVLLLIFPLQYIAGLNSENIDDLVDDRTHLFTDSVREKGYLDKQMYEEYIGFLDSAGERYEIELQDIRPVMGEDISISETNKNTKITALPTTVYKSDRASTKFTKEIESLAVYTHSSEYYAGSPHICNEIDYEYDGEAVLLGVRDKNLYYSNDGSTWTRVNPAISGKVKYENGQFILFSGSNIRTIIYRSIDGINWTGGQEITFHNRPAGSNAYGIHDIVYGDNGYYYAVGMLTYTQDALYRSNDLINWSYLKPLEVYSKKLVVSRVGAQRYLVANIPASSAERGEHHMVARINKNGSLDLYSDWYLDYSLHQVGDYAVFLRRSSFWQSTQASAKMLNESGKIVDIPLPEGAYLTNITYGQGIYLGVSDNRVFKGNEITNMQEITGHNLNIDNINHLIYFNGKYILSGSDTYSSGSGGYTNYLVYSSSDGVTWTRDSNYNYTSFATNEGERECLSITVLPESQTIHRYSWPSFTVRANYNDGNSKLLNASQYSISGFNASNIGLQGVTISYTENGIKKSASVNVMVTVLLKECPRCHQYYELNIDDSDPGCPHCRELVAGIEVTPNYVELTQGDILPITVNAIYKDGSREEVKEWTSNYNPTRIGLQIVTVQYRGYAADISVWVNEGLIKCPTCNTDYPASEESCPVCAEKVIRIVASPKDITVMQYEPISLNVTAYYADGTSREVDQWAIDSTSVAAGTFNATVSYKGVYDTITLRVLSINSTECPICGTIYDLSDSPKGCPICSEEIIGIEAYITSGTNMVQLGTRPGIAVIVIFRDGHREFASEGIRLENYKPHELGVQTIRVLYKEFATTIIIELVNILDTITCPNAHVYNRHEDGTDPGCPFCHEGDDVGNIAYFDITYTSEILDRIYSLGIYHFQEGNYISVIVTKKDKSLLYDLQNTFFSTSMLGRKKRFIYGGEVN